MDAQDWREISVALVALALIEAERDDRDDDRDALLADLDEDTLGLVVVLLASMLADATEAAHGGNWIGILRARLLSDP